MRDFLQFLRETSYPGRGIAVGRDRVYYFIMGRSANSRNRVFVPTEDGIRTEAYDPTKLEDPSLIIYHPVRRVGDTLLVTNGDQTDTIRDRDGLPHASVAGEGVDHLHRRVFLQLADDGVLPPAAADDHELHRLPPCRNVAARRSAPGSWGQSPRFLLKMRTVPPTLA